MEEEDFTTNITHHVVTFKTRDQTIYVRRSLLQQAFFTLQPSGCSSRLIITTSGPTYSFFIPKSVEDLSSEIASLVADLGSS